MKYVLLKPSLLAGLGDSILSLIQALAYAKLSNRALCVDWTGGMYGMPAEENLFDRIFSIDKIPFTSEIPDGSVYPPKWENATHKTFEELRRDNNFTDWDTSFAINNYSTDVRNLDYKEDVLVMWDFQQFKSLLPPLIKNDIIEDRQSVFHGRGEVFNKYVTLKKEPRKYLEKHWSEIAEDTGDHKIIGVHIRETKESKECYGLVSRDRYFNAVDSILKRNPAAGFIFLATDNEEVQQAFFSRYGDRVLFKKKWFDSPGKPIHLGLNKCPDKWENILDAIFDMFALSRCDYLLRRKETSFSKVSQSIGMFEEEDVTIFGKELTTKQKTLNRLSRFKHQFIDIVDNLFN